MGVVSMIFFSNMESYTFIHTEEEKGMTEDEMVEWHHRLNGYELEQALGVGDG